MYFAAILAAGILKFTSTVVFGTLSGRRSLYSGFNTTGGFLPSAGFGDLEASDSVKGRTFRLGLKLAF